MRNAKDLAPYAAAMKRAKTRYHAPINISGQKTVVVVKHKKKIQDLFKEEMDRAGLPHSSSDKSRKTTGSKGKGKGRGKALSGTGTGKPQGARGYKRLF